MCNWIEINENMIFNFINGSLYRIDNGYKDSIDCVLSNLTTTYQNRLNCGSEENAQKVFQQIKNKLLIKD